MSWVICRGEQCQCYPPYAYAVWNTYSVDDVLYDVGGYSVGDMP